MSEPKPLASLNPTLLARKGTAKPAMRPQASATAVNHDDLGWNDMGDSHAPAPAQVVAVRQPVEAEVVPIVPETRIEAHVPEVVRQQQAIEAHVSQNRRSALADGRRAAFTLRVDAERHLKLRLACTIKGRSAQQLVTDALDQLLDSLPDVGVLAETVARQRY